MKSALGLILVICGVCLGLYVGIWWALIGGIMDIVYAVRADILVMSEIFWGLAKVFFAGMIGMLCGSVLIAPGAALMDND